MEFICTEENVAAIETAIFEFGFSTEPGGANHGSDEAEAAYGELSSFSVNLRAGKTVSITHSELAALKDATQELTFSTEAGGANSGSSEVAEHVVLLEQLIGSLEAS